MAQFGRALAASAARQENNNDNVGNARNVWHVTNATLNEVEGNQRITEESRRISGELDRVLSEIKRCETLYRKGPQERKDITDVIDSLRMKGKRTNREETEFRRAIADFYQLENDIRSCQTEMAGLLEKKKQLSTEDFFQSRWMKNVKGLSHFNKPGSSAGAGGPSPRYVSAVGGRRAKRSWPTASQGMTAKRHSRRRARRTRRK
jgi:hypothetical protein